MVCARLGDQRHSSDALGSGSVGHPSGTALWSQAVELRDTVGDLGVSFVDPWNVRDHAADGRIVFATDIGASPSRGARKRSLSEGPIRGIEGDKTASRAWLACRPVERGPSGATRELLMAARTCFTESRRTRTTPLATLHPHRRARTRMTLVAGRMMLHDTASSSSICAGLRAALAGWL